MGQSGHDIGHSGHTIPSGGQAKDEVETRIKNNYCISRTAVLVTYQLQ